jgi:hypothetical protein
MKYFIKTFLFVLLCISLEGVRAQNFSCGTDITPARMAMELQNLQSPMRVPLGRIDKEFCVFAHIVKKQNGSLVITPADVSSLVDGIEGLFAPIGARFKLCMVDTINNWQYDTLFRPTEEQQIYTLYYKPNIINIYFVTMIMKADSSTVAGFAAMPGGDDVIVLSGSGGALPHEMGHFLGLYHTFEDAFGPELPDQSNCSTAGDLICDTDADPYPLGNITNCQVEFSGLPYLPPVDNIMSYWECGCRFTTDQYSRMAREYWLHRTNLW